MGFSHRYRRRMSSSPEIQGLFFDKAHSHSAFFNSSHQTGDRSNLTASSVVQKQAQEEDQPVQKQAQEEDQSVQKQAQEEDQPIQKQAQEEDQPIQKQAQEEDQPVQKQAQEEDQPVQKQEGTTEKKPSQSRITAHPSHEEGEQEQIRGLPDRLKTKIEALSGIPMDDVKVHYNSPKPEQMRALAYTQGTDIYLAPGQEKHLPHEAWHVVQQKQGRVKPTLQTKGIGVNDNPGLEQEATVMGHKAN